MPSLSSTPFVGLLSANATGDGTSGLAGGKYQVSVVGTFGGATVQLQFSPDGGANPTWLDVSGASLTALLNYNVAGGSASGVEFTAIALQASS